MYRRCRLRNIAKSCRSPSVIMSAQPVCELWCIVFMICAVGTQNSFASSSRTNLRCASVRSTRTPVAMLNSSRTFGAIHTQSSCACVWVEMFFCVIWFAHVCVCVCVPRTPPTKIRLIIGYALAVIDGRVLCALSANVAPDTRRACWMAKIRRTNNTYIDLRSLSPAPTAHEKNKRCSINVTLLGVPQPRGQPLVPRSVALRREHFTVHRSLFVSASARQAEAERCGRAIKLVRVGRPGR